MYCIEELKGERDFGPSAIASQTTIKLCDLFRLSRPPISPLIPFQPYLPPPLRAEHRRPHPTRCRPPIPLRPPIPRASAKTLGPASRTFVQCWPSPSGAVGDGRPRLAAPPPIPSRILVPLLRVPHRLDAPAVGDGPRRRRSSGRR
jgi:hypothetical protein